MRLLPASWTTLDTLRIDAFDLEKAPQFQTIKECLKENWTILAPHINLTTPTDPPKTLTPKMVQNIILDNPKTGSLIYLIWNIFLTLAIIWLSLKLRLYPLAFQLPLPSVFADATPYQIVGDALALTAVFAVSIIALWLVYKVIYRLIVIIRAGRRDTSADTGQRGETGILLLNQGPACPVTVTPPIEVPPRTLPRGTGGNIS